MVVEEDEVEEDGDREGRVVGRGGQLRRVRRSQAVELWMLCREKGKRSTRRSSKRRREREGGRSASHAAGITCCRTAWIGTP